MRCFGREQLVSPLVAALLLTAMPALSTIGVTAPQRKCGPGGLAFSAVAPKPGGVS